MELREAIPRESVHWAMSRNSRKMSKNWCINMKNKLKKVVSNATREKAKERLAGLRNCLNVMFS